MGTKLETTTQQENDMTTYNHEENIQTKMTRYEMTREEVIQMEENGGYHDGRNSANFKVPTHTRWPEGPHFNPDYERGYWKGYNQGLQA